MAFMGLLAVGLMMAASPAQAPASDVDSILNGVSEVVAPGCLVGPVAVFGDRAFCVMTGATGKSRLPILAGARYGKGRVILAGHEGLYGTTDRADQKRLIVNTATWLCGGKRNGRVLLVDARPMEATLRAAGFQVRTKGAEDLPAALADTDALYINGGRLTGKPELIEAIAKYVQAGGGYFDGVPGWGWQQLNPGLSLANDYGGNLLTDRMGLTIADGMVDPTGKEGFLADRKGLIEGHAGHALAALKEHASGRKSLDAEALGQAGVTLGNAAGAVPASDRLLLPGLRALIAEAGDSAIPTEAHPLGTDNPVGRIACVLQNIEMRRTPIDMLRAHPAAADFPGAVPADAKRVTRRITVDCRTPDWASTGLYAAPGERIVITLPEGLAQAGLGVRIGAHTDTNWHHGRWTRFPDISYATTLTTLTTTFGSPFGGLIYIVVPQGSPAGLIEVTIQNAVDAPLFVAGKTPLHRWREEIRAYPAPWAELATGKIILTLPASVVRRLDDPEALLAVWDHGLDSIADLAAIPRDRPRPERMCCDRQISAGYMHSGYPIMNHLDVIEVMVDRDRLFRDGAKTCWGFWHELGHNHQAGDWTFEGTGETTNNLFSLYCCERVSNETVAANSWLNVSERNKRVAKYFADGAKYAEWQSDPALSLMFYAQLQQAFGWGAYQRLFAEYRQLPDASRPKDDQDKRDQFMVRFSRQVGYDLGPFFASWGIPIRDAARQSVAHLPEWKPAGFREGIPPASP